MESSSILLKPTPKKPSREYFPRQAPFPIFSNQSEEDEDENSSNQKRKYFLGYLEEGCVMITDTESMKSIYTMGFFGKGTLSRGGPKVCFPHQDSKSKTITESERNVESNSESSSTDSDNEQQQKCKKRKVSADKAVRGGSGNSVQKQGHSNEDLTEEKLQLSFEESFFLSYGLGCLVVIDGEQPLDLQRLWEKFCNLTPHQRFPVMYTAYHHFRSKGWVVRCGIKYGADFLLYKDGPFYYHSTYAVIVKPLAEKNLKEILSRDKSPLTWISLAAKNRLLAQVSKGLIFLYVIKPKGMSENKVSTPFCVSQFKLQEVFVKRWVSSTGREEEEEEEENL